MRKSFSFILSVILTSILMLPCGASASAAWPFWFDSQPQFPSGYGYSQQHQQMDSNKTRVEIRHNVVGNTVSAGFTNLLGIYERGAIGAPGMGTKWFAPNGVYYAMSVTLHKNHFYAPYGRANTKFYEQYGLTTIRIEGQWRAY